MRISLIEAKRLVTGNEGRAACIWGRLAILPDFRLVHGVFALLLQECSKSQLHSTICLGRTTGHPALFA